VAVEAMESGYWTAVKPLRECGYAVWLLRTMTLSLTSPVTKVMAMLAVDVALKLLELQFYFCSAFCSWCHYYRVAAHVVGHSTVA
jgi:hypothetical protein